MNPPPIPPAPPPIPPAGPQFLPPPPPAKKGGIPPIACVILVLIVLGFIALLAVGAYGGYKKVIEGVRKKQAAAEQLKQKAKGADDESIGTRAAAVWQKQITASSGDLSKLTARLNEIGMMNASGILTKEDLTARRELAHAIIAADKKLSSEFGNSPRDLAALLEGEGLAKNRIAPILEGILGSLPQQIPLITRIRAINVERMQEMLLWTDLIETEWGAWKAEGAQFTFEKQEAVDQHDAHLEKLNKLAKEQSEVQAKLKELRDKSE